MNALTFLNSTALQHEAARPVSGRAMGAEGSHDVLRDLAEEVPVAMVFDGSSAAVMMATHSTAVMAMIAFMEKPVMMSSTATLTMTEDMAAMVMTPSTAEQDKTTSMETLIMIRSMAAIKWTTSMGGQA